jgi:Fur family transcriptional regulator, peroxide stress response regulator
MLSVYSLCERLHKDGKKITPQRRLIYQALERRTNHPSAEDIYEEVRAIIPDISLATIYKTLRELVTMGELLEVTFQGDQLRFDTTVTPHHHLVCLRCHTIENIMEQIAIPEPVTLKERNFRLRQSEVIYWGLCSSCQS